jgi:putative aldouronate transport system substrate-binding protein
MKKFGKILVGLTLGVTTAIGLAACGGNNTPAPSTPATPPSTEGPAAEAPAGEIEKPSKITMMVNGTFTNVASGQNEIVAKYKELTGIDLDITTVDHNAYYDQLSIAFASGINQDVVILGSTYYPAYAAQGALWDMASAWENSELRASGRVNEAYVDALYMGDALYGFGHASGNGCLTYIRKDWLDRLGLDVPTTYDEYLDVLRAFTNGDPDGNGIDGDTYGVTAAGILGTEAPYTNYLPEFWQDAYPDFYQQADGTWIDGFSEDKTAAALQRLKDAYAEGIIDMEVATNKTSTCRDKFYASQVGVFTYWAGQWMMTLEQNTKAITPEAELVGIPPIAELGNYIERQAPVLAITPAAKNPEGVFKYLFEFMLDGAEGQTLFTYGVENVHWEQSAEGLKHLPSMENPSNTFTKVYIDGVLSIGDWINGDPVQTRDPRVTTSSDIFSSNAVIAPVVVSNDVMASYAATLLDIRTVIVAEVVTGNLTVEQGMAKYQDQAGAMVTEILASLN